MVLVYIFRDTCWPMIFFFLPCEFHASHCLVLASLGCLPDAAIKALLSVQSKTDSVNPTSWTQLIGSIHCIHWKEFYLFETGSHIPGWLQIRCLARYPHKVRLLLPPQECWDCRHPSFFAGCMWCWECKPGKHSIIWSCIPAKESTVYIVGRVLLR